MAEEKKCCICGKKIEGYGNDPWGAAWTDENGNVCRPTYNVGEECCAECNKRYVIPGRVALMIERRRKQDEPKAN